MHVCSLILDNGLGREQTFIKVWKTELMSQKLSDVGNQKISKSEM